MTKLNDSGDGILVTLINSSSSKELSSGGKSIAKVQNHPNHPEQAYRIKK
jgi:hypothetical protein